MPCFTEGRAYITPLLDTNIESARSNEPSNGNERSNRLPPKSTNGGGVAAGMLEESLVLGADWERLAGSGESKGGS